MTIQLERDIREGRLGIAVGDDGNAYTYQRTSWYAVDLEPVKRGEVTELPPAYLARDDGRRLIYPGRAHTFFGPSESLKSWAALLACKSVLELQRTAIYVDFEDAATSFVDRCRTLGIPDAAIGTRLAYVRPEDPLVTFDRQGKMVPGNAKLDLDEVRMALAPALIVLDGVTEAYALHGWNPNAADDAARYQALLLRRPGTATLEIDHTPHGIDRQIGSQHKRAGLDGAAYGFKAKTNGGRGGSSSAEITVAKDRHGMIREWAVRGAVGTFHLDPDVAEIRAPTYAEAMGRDVELFRAVCEWIGANPGESTNAVKNAIPGRAYGISEALAVLEPEGYVRHTPGPRNSKLWELVKPYTS